MKISFDEDREVVELITLMPGDFFEYRNEQYMVVDTHFTKEQNSVKAIVKFSGFPTLCYMDKQTEVTELEQIKPLSLRYKRPGDDDEG